MATAVSRPTAPVRLPLISCRSLALVSSGLLSLLMLADFVFRGVALASHPGKTDFTELYTSAWLWRHGMNFYDSGLVTTTAERLTGSDVIIAPVYPSTTLVAVAPFTFLPWGWANCLWLSLALAGGVATIICLIRLGNFTPSNRWTLLLATFLLAFDPIHQAFHLGNIALLVMPLCFAGIHLADREQNVLAGIALSLATLLKPQLGVWVLLFYLIQWRKRLTAGAVLPALAFALALSVHRVPVQTLVSSYRSNLERWFGTGRPYGFTDGALPFHVNISQVVLYQLWPSVQGVSLLANAIFILGLAIWAFASWRGRFRASVPLAVSSLIALSFISLYHSVSDVAILTLALCWAFPRKEETWLRPQRLTFLILFLMLLPGHSLLMRLSPHLSESLLNSWWWKLFIARYFVWLLLALNAVLLYALVSFSRSMRSVAAEA